ncbi:MAG: hypothetical protein R2771_01440 [Saprospiraceae bacterium]
MPVQNEYNIKKSIAKSKIKQVCEAVLGYDLSDNATYILNSGRYEFKNKGIDVFPQSIAKLEDTNPENEVVGIIAVPAGILGPQ